MSLPSWCPHKPLPALEQLVLAQSQAWICACLHGMCVRTKQVSPKAKPTPNPGAARRWELGMGTWAGNLGWELGLCPERRLWPRARGRLCPPRPVPLLLPATVPGWPTSHWAGAAAHGDSGSRTAARALQLRAGCWSNQLGSERAPWHCQGSLVTLAAHLLG